VYIQTAMSVSRAGFGVVQTPGVQQHVMRVVRADECEEQVLNDESPARVASLARQSG
jgi:hypothetical protein